MVKRLLFAATILSLTACSGNDVRNTLGMKRKAPDEFAVLSHAPLSVPPDFNLVSPADPMLNKDRTVDEAKQALLKGSNSSSKAGKSGGEKAFLSKAKVGEIDPAIRQKIAAENAQNEEVAYPEEEEEKGFFASILDPVIPDKKDPVVDAAAEKERINKNKAEGKPVTEGDVKTKSQGTGTVLDKVLKN